MRLFLYNADVRNRDTQVTVSMMRAAYIGAAGLSLANERYHIFEYKLNCPSATSPGPKNAPEVEWRGGGVVQAFRLQIGGVIKLQTPLEFIKLQRSLITRCPNSH